VTDLDLSAAVEAGYRAWCDASSGFVHSDAVHEALRSETEVSRIRVAVAAAAPLIEAQVREQIAEAIMMAHSDVLPEHNCGDPACPTEASLVAYRLAARIARGTP